MNIEINCLDIESSQSRADSLVFRTKKHKSERPCQVKKGTDLCFLFFRKKADYRALIFLERRETVRAALFKAKMPLRAALIMSDSAILNAAAASSLLQQAIAASTFLTKVRTRFLRAPLMTFLLLFLTILFFADL